jgi:TolB protein
MSWFAGNEVARRVVAGLVILFAALALAAGSPANPQSGPGARSDDPLGTLVVTPGAGRPLPKVGVVPSLSADMADVVLRSVVLRDLDLSGEVELLPDRAAPGGADASEEAVDTEAWRGAGVAAVVRVTATTAAATGEVSLFAQVVLVKKGSTPIFDWKSTVGSARLRAESHRIADLVIGALTGQNGGFYSRMTFTSGQGSIRSAYVMDADGHDLHTVSSPAEVAVASAFGKNGDVYWASSVGDDPHEVRSFKGPISLPIQGSVYGLAFSKDGSHVAVSIGTLESIFVFIGSDFASLRRASEVKRAIEPTFTPAGKLAYSGAGATGQRIYVGDAPITPEGVFATSPTFCNHPDGAFVIFAAGAGKNTDLVRTGEKGGPLARLTAGQGSNGYPACSPDGRLVAFFSTRTTGEGPGLYIMRTDGRRPKRVSTLLGSALQWAPLPPPPPRPAPVPALAPAAQLPR